MNAIIRKLIIGATVVLACVSLNRCCFAQGPPDSDEYSVYAALFQEKHSNDPNAQLVIDNTTAIDHFFSDRQSNELVIQNLIKALPQLAKETAVDFLTKNQTAWPLKNEFNLKAETILITSEEKKNLFKGDIEEGWKLFNSKYPRATSINTLSRVGFNQGNTQALIYYGYSCGGLCGAGHYILLTKKEGKWTIETERMTWIS